MSEQTTQSQASDGDTEATKPGGGLTPIDRDKSKDERGTTTIADGVVAKIAGIAAREVAGVYDMGGAPARALGNVTQRVGISDQRAQGVSVEVGEKQAAVDLTVQVEYGEAIPRVTDEIRQNVIRRIEGLCGREVIEVNISVTDLHFPGDDEPGSPVGPVGESRVD